MKLKLLNTETLSDFAQSIKSVSDIGDLTLNKNKNYYKSVLEEARIIKNLAYEKKEEARIEYVTAKEDVKICKSSGYYYEGKYVRPDCSSEYQRKNDAWEAFDDAKNDFNIAITTFNEIKWAIESFKTEEKKLKSLLSLGHEAMAKANIIVSAVEEYALVGKQLGKLSYTPNWNREIKNNSSIQKSQIISKYNTFLKTKNSKRYNPNKPALKDKFKKLSIYIPPSKLGFVPDFQNTPFIFKKNNVQAIIKIKIDGSKKDFTSAYKSLKKIINIDNEDFSNYTWHHMDDYDPLTKECSLQLVERKWHEATYPHFGGAGQSKFEDYD